MAMRPLTAALLALASTAAAEPAHFAAPSRDVPVRDAPGGEVVGALPAGRGPVEAVRIENGWALIGEGERDVWAAVDALAPMTPPMLAGSTVPAGLLCAGTEPFWSLRLGPDAAELASPDHEAVTLPIAAVRVAEGRAGHPVAVRIDALTAVIRPALCRDGMSDSSHPWSIDLVLIEDGGAGLRTGCCRLPAE